MSKRTPTGTNLQITRGGNEFYEAMPWFSSDLVWLVLLYAAPYVTRQDLITDILTQTAAARVHIDRGAFVALPHKSICRLDRSLLWTIVDKPIGWASVFAMSGLCDVAPAPIWLMEYQKDKDNIRNGKFKCSNRLWDLVCLESAGGIIHKFKPDL